MDEATLRDVQAVLSAGSLILAIKVLRERVGTGISIHNAMDVVLIIRENLEQQDNSPSS